MDVEEIQAEITRLTSADVDRLSDWLTDFRQRQHVGENHGSVVSLSEVALSTTYGGQGVVTDDPEELAERARELEELKANLKRWRDERG